MNAVKHILMTVCTGIVLWLMTLVGGLAWAMFSTPGSRQRTEALWGAVYFETSPSKNGVLMQFGLENMRSVLLLLLACLAACAAISLIAKACIKGHAGVKGQKVCPESRIFTD